MKYRADIDGLRSIAIVPVVLYHAGFPGFSGGFVGVDVFFVISGFLITNIISEEISSGRFSLISFYERRARRILPALVFVILTALVAGWLLLLPSEFQSLGQSVFATGLFVSNFYFVSSLDYFSTAAEFAPLLHTWSLAVEEQFYLIFPLLLMFIAWTRLASFRIVFGLTAISLICSIYALQIKPDWVFYLIPFRAWELGAGALLALGSLRPIEHRVAREGLLLLAISGILIPIFAFGSLTPFPGLGAFPPVFGATILIWIGAAGGGSFVNIILSQRAFVWVGLISYSLYLWHWPILSFLRIVLGTIYIPTEIAIIAVSLSVLMAWISYQYIEGPFRPKPPKGFKGKSILIASAFALVAVLCFGAILHVTRGLPSRIPEDVTTIASFSEDINGRRGECFNRSPDNGLCSIGAEGDAVDFLFWGDSHADAMMPGMDRSAQLVGETGLFAGHSACPPILYVQRAGGGQNCADFNRDVFDWLQQSEDIRLVILGARWTLSVEGKRYRGEAGPELDLAWTGPPLAADDLADNASLVEAGLRETALKILSSGRQVVLLGPIPEIGQDVPISLAREGLTGWSSLRPVSVTDYQKRSQKTESILKKVANSIDGVRYLDLAELFCGPEFCRFTNDAGLPLYIDDDHINKTASLELLPMRLVDIWE